MNRFTIRAEEAVESTTGHSGFTHISIVIYDPSGERATSVEGVSDGVSLGGFSVLLFNQWPIS